MSSPPVKPAGLLVVVADPVVDACLEALYETPGMTVEYLPEASEPALRQALVGADALIVRSGTEVSAELMAAAPNLRVVARAGTGVDNIDLAAATERGILVMNAPSGNTIAAAEHSLSLLLAMARNIPAASASVRAGEWRRGAFMGFELLGKVLGVLGLGRIGREVARRAVAFGMEVVAYDPYVEAGGLAGVEVVALERLYERAQIISVHLPLLDSTRHMLDDAAFARMRDGVRLVNAARGGIVDEAALERALESGKVAGCALDVFENEPPGDHPLLARDDVLATPHLGAATREAQEQVALTIAQQVIDFLGGGPVAGAVNLPSVSRDARAALTPFLHLGERLGALLAQMAEGPARALRVGFLGEVALLDHELIALAMYKGLLSPHLGDRVNFINCRAILKERGVSVVHETSDDAGEARSVLAMTLETTGETHTVAASLRLDGSFRLVEVDGYALDATPAGDLIILKNRDEPGVVGRIGTVLGNDGVNIAQLTWGRVAARPGTALTVIATDEALSPAGLATLQDDPTVIWARQVSLAGTPIP